MRRTPLHALSVLGSLAAAAVLTVPAAGASTHSPSAPRICGVVTVMDQGKRYGYSVRIAAGRVTCVRARTALRGFLARDASPRGWFCARGHASQHQKWAAQCANPGGAVVRAFGPLKG